jgi:microcystin-dependent protein
MDPATGSGSAHHNVQPAVIVNYILRVLFNAQR